MPHYVFLVHKLDGNVIRVKKTKPGYPKVNWDDLHHVESFFVQTSSRCMDCGMETIPYNYRCIKDDLWKGITIPKERRGMLCISCMEKRLGRKLKRTDLNHE